MLALEAVHRSIGIETEDTSFLLTSQRFEKEAGSSIRILINWSAPVVAFTVLAQMCAP